MEFNLLTTWRNQLANWISPAKRKFEEVFLSSFLKGLGDSVTPYPEKSWTYISSGYNVNPIVFSIINQQAQKTASIPFFIKRVKDQKARQELERIIKATNRSLSLEQKLRVRTLERKAYQDETLPMPIDRPNPNQTWAEFLALYKTYLKLTGNVFILMLSPSTGRNQGEPQFIYILPSQYVKIVVRNDVDLLSDTMDVIDGYLLELDGQAAQFDKDSVIHIKYANPNFDENGSQLYGMSPLRSALKNVQSSNLGLELNMKTLKNGGAFGFIHGKNMAITSDQAAEIKERMLEMDSNPERLSKIAGISAEIGFTRISLTTDELKPFEFLSFDTKMICNVLSWSDKLLNNDAGAKYDNVSQYRKQVVTDNIYPDLKLLSDALNVYFLPRFKAYKGTEIEFDISELPEMQTDTKELADWLNGALDRGVITRNEYRIAISYVPVNDDNMDKHTVQSDVLRLDEALDNLF